MTLKERRKANNLTQAKLAEFLGIPLRTYKRYERDEEKIPEIKQAFILSKLEEYGKFNELNGVLSIDTITEVCRRVLGSYDVQYCYLFGSYAKGQAKEDSDVDLLISTTLTGLKFFGMVEELREGLGKRVDVLNQDQIKNNGELTDEILKTGIKIYG